MAYDDENRLEVALPEDTVIEANIEGALDAGDEVIGRVKITDGVEVANVNASNQVEVSVENTVVADVTGQGDVPITLDSEVVEVDATGQGDVPITLDSEVVEVDATGSGDIPITLDSEVVEVDATGQGDIPITLDSEVVEVDATGQGDIPITLDSEVVEVDATGQGDVPVTTNGDTITQTPTVTAGAYSVGDNVGGLLTFANAALVSGKGGVIKNILIIDDAGQDAELELWLFDTTFTPGNDNDAWAPTEAELHTLITVISTEDSAQGWIAGGTPSICGIEVARRYDCTGTSLFGRLVTRGTPTYIATDDITVRIMLLQD